jgi:hypothetical protein
VCDFEFHLDGGASLSGRTHCLFIKRPRARHIRPAFTVGLQLLAKAGGHLTVAFHDLLDLCLLRFRQIKRAKHVAEAAAIPVPSAAPATTLRKTYDGSRNHN